MKNRIILFVNVLLGCVTALKAQNREYSAEIDTNYIPVSYTHLDVYKRQSLFRKSVILLRL